MAAEKLSEHPAVRLSRETLRGWMIADGLWQDRRNRLPAPHQPAPVGADCRRNGADRRPEHAWFRGSRSACTLLAFVDDATSRLMQLRFVTLESAFDYFRTTRAYLAEHGKPVALYSDQHGIFRVNSKDAAGGDGVTQFGSRAVGAEHRHHLCQQARKAKGRIETRVWHVAGTGWSRACPREGGGAAAGGDIVDCRGERRAGWVHRWSTTRASA